MSTPGRGAPTPARLCDRSAVIRNPNRDADKLLSQIAMSTANKEAA
jgi:hypothetical protein